jgi:hypothetical protein
MTSTIVVVRVELDVDAAAWSARAPELSSNAKSLSMPSFTAVDSGANLVSRSFRNASLFLARASGKP